MLAFAFSNAEVGQIPPLVSAIVSELLSAAQDDSLYFSMASNQKGFKFYLYRSDLRAILF